MRDPIFSYNLTRAYPVRWFTPLVIGGGILATVLVSVLSVATSGYQLNSVPSSNPNATEAGKSWFGRGLGSILGSMQPVCASTTIPLNALLYTNNTALSYTLEGISLAKSDGNTSSQGSLVYHNNLLQDCIITSIEIDFESLQRSAFAFAVQQQGADLTGYLQCQIESPQGITTISLATKWSYVNAGPNAATFVNRDPREQSSFYWANSLLSMYWIELTNAMYENNNLYADNDPESYGFYKGYVNLTRSSATSFSIADIKSQEFFDAQCWFMPFNGTGRVTNMAYCENAPRPISSLSNGTVSEYSHNAPLPMIWTPVDSLSKAFYYSILADLGQTHIALNLLTNAELLEYFTSNFTAIHASFGTIPGMNAAVGDHQGTSNMPFTDANATTTTLSVDNSTLAINYLCQVPRLKPTGSLIVSVLVADLVLLQTIWKIFKLVIDHVLLHRQPQMQYCEGCLQSMQVGEQDNPQQMDQPLSPVIEDIGVRGQYAAVDPEVVELDNLLQGETGAQGQRPSSLM